MHSKIRLRPSYFPFTNASVEVDVSCYACWQKATNWCALCKNSQYLEILGAGLIAPEVYEACSLQVTGLNGFAFGLGLERIAMILYQIADIRSLYTNDLVFCQNIKTKGL